MHSPRESTPRGYAASCQRDPVDRDDFLALRIFIAPLHPSSLPLDHPYRRLLRAVQYLRDEWNASNAIWITDQFLPAFHWLLGTCSVEQVQAYAQALAPILHPLQRLLVSLEADVRESWRRAVVQRGQE